MSDKVLHELHDSPRMSHLDIDHSRIVFLLLLLLAEPLKITTCGRFRDALPDELQR